MRSLFYLLITFFLVQSTFAQDTMTAMEEDTIPKNFIKVYKNFRYESLPDLVFDGNDFNYYVERQDIFASGFGVAFAHHNNETGKFWEIGVAELMFAGSNTTTSFIEVDTLLFQGFQEVNYKRRDIFGQLSVGMTLGESDSGKWRMTAAAAVLPFFQSLEIDPGKEQTLAVNANIIGASLAAIPSFQFRLFKKGYLEISLPIRVLRAAGFAGESGNPFLNLHERQQTTADVDFVPSIYELRIGLALGL